MVEVVYEWARGMSFNRITDLTDVMEGTIVRVITRLDETCREVKNAARIIGDPVLFQKMGTCQELIKRYVCLFLVLAFDWLCWFVYSGGIMLTCVTGTFAIAPACTCKGCGVSCGDGVSWMVGQGEVVSARSGSAAASGRWCDHLVDADTNARQGLACREAVPSPLNRYVGLVQCIG